LKSIKKPKESKHPFTNHKRTKEANLPFTKASRTIYENKSAYALFGTRGYKYTGENRLSTEEVPEGEEGYLDVETVINVLLHELMVTKSELVKLKKVVEKSEVV